MDLGFWILAFGFWILDFGFRILDFGFWIVVVSVLFVAAPNAAVWILDFGFWILGTVWILHKIMATTRRLGSADFLTTKLILNQMNDLFHLLIYAT